ncbi:unnamed protein product [Cylindrotheca closterium]|uniref:C2 domain-containing protein n=1 Tax=Cylindrotheca closterium TaxID=2856 RepID=A0AAD2FG51_9STRA|nr:unnamed protein product [Cylindrotheca closterium]
MGRITMNGTITVDDTDGQIEVQDNMLGAYQLSLSAQFLSRFKVSSSYASVKIIEGSYRGTDLGETECIPRSSTPDWCKTFFLDFVPGDGTVVEISIYDFNNGSTAYKIGGSRIRIEEVAKRKGIEVPLSGSLSNVLMCRLDKCMMGTEKGDLIFHIRGLDMNNKEPGPFGLGRSDPFYEISKKHPDSSDSDIEDWNAVYRSEHITNHLNPMWKDARLGLPELCFGDLDWPLKITVYDYDKNGKHDEMGSVVTSVKEMQQRISIRGNSDRAQAFMLTKELRGRQSNTGFLCILKASIGPPGDRKTIRAGRKQQDGGGKLSAWIAFGLLIFMVLLPLIIGLVIAREEEMTVDTTPETTFDSYYDDYKRDLNVTLRDGIKSGYLSGHHALDPQTKALDWLTTQDSGSNVTTNSTSELLQRYAMAVFYYATDGDNWNRNTTFLSDASVCDWGSNYGDGVTCNGAGQVTSFRLFNRGLTGSLPSEIGLLFSLRGIFLSMNNITGIPSRIGSLRNLEDLYLSRNDLLGGIPESISKLRNLESLHIQDNPRLTGDLDPLCSNVKPFFYGAADCKKPDLICSCCKACS